jgi:hypothetical protein
MCILPNFSERNLEEFRRKGKEEPKKALDATTEIITPEQVMENSI